MARKKYIDNQELLLLFECFDFLGCKRTLVLLTEKKHSGARAFV